MCTSGGYYRGFQINGAWYSHLIDPRTGRPKEAGTQTPASVTVLADDCITADYWATAMAVLGEDGLNRLPENVHVYMIIGTPENHRIVKSPRFPECSGR